MDTVPGEDRQRRLQATAAHRLSRRRPAIEAAARHPRRHPPPSSASVMRMAAIRVETEQKRRTDLPAALKNTAAGAQHGGLAV